MKAVSAQEMTTTRLCSKGACLNEADGEDGLCRSCRQAAAPPKRVTTLLLRDPLGLELPAGASFVDWAEALHSVALVSSASNFWIGDLLNADFADDHKYELAEAELGLARTRLYDLAYVARAVPRERRDRRLKWSHARWVAPLTPEQQTEWLERAAVERLTPTELLNRLTAAGLRGVPTSDSGHGRPEIPIADEDAERVLALRAGGTSEEKIAAATGLSRHLVRKVRDPSEQLEQLRLTIVLRAELAARLRTVARERGTSMSQLAAEALERHLGLITATSPVTP